MTTGQAAVIDRVTLIVSDLDRAEEDYVTTFGCRVEHRADIDPALTRVLCIPPARGRRSLLRRVPGPWRTANGTGSFLGVDHTAIAVRDTARSARFFRSVFGFSTGTRTENCGPGQDTARQPALSGSSRARLIAELGRPPVPFHAHEV